MPYPTSTRTASGLVESCRTFESVPRTWKSQCETNDLVRQETDLWGKAVKVSLWLSERNLYTCLFNHDVVIMAIANAYDISSDTVARTWWNEIIDSLAIFFLDWVVFEKPSCEWFIFERTCDRNMSFQKIGQRWRNEEMNRTKQQGKRKKISQDLQFSQPRFFTNNPPASPYSVWISRNVCASRTISTIPISAPVGKHLYVTILRSNPSFNHNLFMMPINCIVNASWRKSSPTL